MSRVVCGECWCPRGDEGECACPPTLYDHTGDIKDLNTLLVPAAYMRQLRAALQEWHDKTDWVRASVQPRDTGRHVADVIRERAERTELEKDAAKLLFALHDAWPSVHQFCTIESRKANIIALMRKHGDFAK